MNQSKITDNTSYRKTRAAMASSVLPLGFLLCWELMTRLEWLPQTLIATPLQTLYSLVSLATSGELWLHTSSSCTRLFQGYLLGALMGVSVGSITGLSRTAETLFNPLFRLLAPVPPIAWIPLLIILMGIGESSKMALIAIASFTILYFHTFQALRAVDQQYIELALTYGKNTWELFVHVLLPGATGEILNALRIALGTSWILLVAAELIASSSGLGWLIWNARTFSRPDEMLSGMICLGILGAASDYALSCLERRLLCWRISYEGL